jgi:Uma2 family endonuclease
VLRTDLDETRISTAADAPLVIEVSDSAGHFARTVKLPRYAAAGVPEVWIAFPQTRTVERYREPFPDGYAERSRFTAGEEIEAFGHELPVDAMVQPAV